MPSHVWKTALLVVALASIYLGAAGYFPSRYPKLESRRKVMDYMGVVRSIAEEDARINGGRYPATAVYIQLQAAISKLKLAEINSSDQEKRKQIDDLESSIQVQSVADRVEAIEQSQKLRPEQIMFCPLRQAGAGYFILAKDMDGRFLQDSNGKTLILISDRQKEVRN